MKMLIRLLTVSLILQCGPAFAEGIAGLQKRWAVANYELQAEAQSAAFESLTEDAGAAVLANPEDADLLIWKGIIESTYAGKTSGLDALGLIKSARRSLEAALKIDPMALDGSAYTSLGALYYQVPPWPIAFGSDKKARSYLKKALEINPGGIDSNYFYGAFLIEEKEFVAAKSALSKAMQAPARPDRPLADKGRREEIQQLLQVISEQG